MTASWVAGGISRFNYSNPIIMPEADLKVKHLFPGHSCQRCIPRASTSDRVSRARVTPT